MDQTFTPSQTREEDIVARENVNPLPMIKTLIASGVAVSAAALASPALADGFYLTLSSMRGWAGSDWFGGTLS